jgi:hypothetical protein
MFTVCLTMNLFSRRSGLRKCLPEMTRGDVFWRKFVMLREEWAHRSSDCAALKTPGTSVTVCDLRSGL